MYEKAHKALAAWKFGDPGLTIDPETARQLDALAEEHQSEIDQANEAIEHIENLLTSATVKEPEKLICTWSSEDSNWATFAYGHIPLEDFAELVIAEGQADEIIVEIEVMRGDGSHVVASENEIRARILENAQHLYFRRMTTDEIDAIDCNKEIEWHDWCGADEPGAIPVTAYTYEP